LGSSKMGRHHNVFIPAKQSDADPMVCLSANWGENGYGWLPYAYVEAGLADDFWSMELLAKVGKSELPSCIIRLPGAIFVVNGITLAVRLACWHIFPDSGRKPSCSSGRIGVRWVVVRCHCRSRINWSADRTRTPNIKWLITLVSPLTIRCLPPNSSLSRALLRSAAVRSL